MLLLRHCDGLDAIYHGLDAVGDACIGHSSHSSLKVGIELPLVRSVDQLFGRLAIGQRSFKVLRQLLQFELDLIEDLV